MKTKKKTPRNEFRGHKPSGHIKYIYEKVGNEFRFLGITHSEVSRGKRNLKLERNPDPNTTNDRPIYMQTDSETDKTHRFREIKKGWKLSEKDRQAVKKVIAKDNKKRSAPSRSQK